MNDHNGTEYFDIVDDAGRVIGRASRAACHGDPSLIHRSVHIYVFNRRGEILLQLRSTDKDIQPGRWDTSVGGHLDSGEEYDQAARRELCEELGLELGDENPGPDDGNPGPAGGTGLAYLFDIRIRNEIESENARVYAIRSEGPFDFAADEIDEVRFWSPGEIEAALGTGMLTPNLEREFAKLEQSGLLDLGESDGDG
jgi:isopentenyldiphosphate isomerase